MSRDWSAGHYTRGINALLNIAVDFLFSDSCQTRDRQQTNNNRRQLRETIETASALTPALAISPNEKRSENLFNNIFRQEPRAPEREKLSKESFMAKFNEEVTSYINLLNDNGAEIIASCESTREFWLSNRQQFPLLYRLACFLLNINSSSACIERFFSICGFVQKKNSSNIKSDLFKARCLLEANLDLLAKLVAKA